MKKSITIIITLILTFSTLILSGCTGEEKIQNRVVTINYTASNVQSTGPINTSSIDSLFDYLESAYDQGESYIASKDQIKLKSSDNKNYTFEYNNEIYTANYYQNNWHINNSYKIRNKDDIKLICEALMKEHPIYGKDMKTYRTADDMINEWVDHNIAYDYLPDGNSWKDSARDVDLNPDDQGKSLKDLYEDRANTN